jgi:NAD(P)-dependent dehydrogenase (short-subunit alcohol dehydrogenase family)
VLKFDFSGKRVVITGGGVGIGLEIIRSFAAAGARVCAADIVVTDAMQAAVQGAGGVALQLDLGQRGAPEKLVEASVAQMGGVDILVNNLGASPVREGFLQTSDDDWHSLFNVNFFSMVRATRAALPHLLESRGVVVSIASVLAREPLPIQPDYCATKAAILNVTQTLATEFGPKGVRFVVVSPGPTLTPQWTDPGGQIEQYAAKAGVTPEVALKTVIPEALGLALRRFVNPSEIANAVQFAASDAASAITGTEIIVDAGMHNAV